MMQLQMFTDGGGQLLLEQMLYHTFRMFNPIRQSERFDNNARYIKLTFQD